MLNAEAMSAWTTPGWTSSPPTLTGAAPACCRVLDRFQLLRRGGQRDRRRARPVLPPRWAAAAICAWRISEEQFVYSSASALSSFSACLYALWLKPLSDWP